MTTGTLLAVLLAVAAMILVLAPLLRRESPEREAQREASLDELRELHAREHMLLCSLKDLEDDRATDKIGEGDYARLKARLSTQAIEVMQRRDAVEQERALEAQREREAARPLRYPGKRDPDGPP